MDPTDRAATLLARSYSAVTGSLQPARSDVARSLAAVGAGSDVVDRASLVVSELATNAIEASPGGEFTVRVGRDGAVAVIVVANPSSGRVPPRDRWTPDDVLARRGRGLAIVDAVADAVEVTTGGGQVSVEVRLAFATAD